MTDILAVVSKAIFDRALRDEALAEGSVWQTKSYASANKGLMPLAKGGRLFLVTVRPPDEALWLVAILEKPKFDGKQWLARANVTPICDVSSLRSKIRFESGTGMPTKAGVLGMSLQTPRALTAEDATLLTGAKKNASKGSTSKKQPTATPPTPARKTKSTKTKTTRARSPAKTAAKTAPEVTLDHDALLAAWRKTRSPRIADLLQLVPVDDAWTKRLAAIAKGGTSRAVRDRLNNLPDDPRSTVFYIECLRKARWPGSGARTLWTAIFRRLVSLADARAIAPLREAVVTVPYFLGAGYTAWIVSQIAETADALEKITAKHKPDDAATRTLIDAQQAAAPAAPAAGWFPSAKPASETLLKNVWAAPDDEGARAVAADALLEQNDGWGELITLQLQGGTKHHEQEKKLIRKHASRMAGPIAKIASIATLTFERGFLASCVVGKSGMIGRRLWEDALRAPHWATVHTVKVDYYDQPPRWWLVGFYATASIASLRTIKIGTVVLERSSATAAWKVTSAPQRVDDRITSALEALVKGMPVSERTRIPTPTSSGIREILDGLD